MKTSVYVFTQILTSAWSTVSIALCIIYIRCVHTLISLWAPFITWQTVLYTSPTPFRTISWNFCRIRINTLKYCIKYLIINKKQKKYCVSWFTHFHCFIFLFAWIEVLAIFLSIDFNVTAMPTISIRVMTLQLECQLVIIMATFLRVDFVVFVSSTIFAKILITPPPVFHNLPGDLTCPCLCYNLDLGTNLV